MKNKIKKKNDYEKGVKKVKRTEKIKEPKEIREIIETDVDKLYDLIRNKGIIKVNEAAKILNTNVDQVEEWGKILEEHKLIRLRYPPIGEPVLILKRFTSNTEKIKDFKKVERKLKKAFLINFLILIAFFSFIVFYLNKTQPMRITLTYTQAYLITAVIIIIGLIIIWKIKRVKHGSRTKTDKNQ